MIKTIITGGSRGIGKEIISKLLLNNHKVFNISRTNCDIKNENLINIESDIYSDSTLTKIKDLLQKEIKINNFIHNAGITDDIFFHKMKKEQWNTVMNVNFLSLYNLLNPIVINMRNNNEGNIIFISSVNGKKGAIGQTNYASSKSAMFGMTKSLALENANKNILINCICPGYIKTEMTSKIDPKILNDIINTIPLKRLGNPEDIANLIEFLLSKNKYMTGTILDINGGMY